MKTKADIEVFTSFGCKYPEYEIITPQTKKSYTIRSMDVDDEEVLKGSMVTTSKLPRHIAEVIWKCLVKKPDDIKTFDDFISRTTLEDRDALLYGLYVSTYRDIQNYSIKCDCGYDNYVKVNLENCISAEFWDESKGSIIDYKPKVDLEIFNSVHCILKIPTLKDEIIVSERNNFADEKTRNLAVQLLRIEKFVQDASAELPHGDEVTQPENIVKAFKSLPAKDRKIIEKKFNEEFGKYQVKITPKVKCQKCGKLYDVEIEIYQQFFRALFQ